MFCSDGLTDDISGNEIAATVKQARNACHVCRQLISAAIQRDGDDNISADALKSKGTEKQGKRVHQMSTVTLECRLARNYVLENVAGSLAYLLVKATPNPEVSFGSLPLNLGLVIDVSRSMKGKKIECAREASKFVVESLSPEDTVSVVIFSDDARAIVPLSEARDKDAILSAIDRIGTVSGTRMYCGIETALAEMRKGAKRGSISRMVILTDGETEGEERCLAIAEERIRGNLVISTFGIGDEYNEVLVKTIADTCLGGTYHLQMPEEMQGHFQTEVDAARAAVITNVILSLRLADDVRLEEMHRIFPNSAKLQPGIEPDGKTYTVDVNSLRIKESSCFGVKMVLPARAGGPATEAQVSLRYDVPNLEIEGHTEECDVVVEYTADRDLSGRIDREVVNYFNQLNVESLINEAIQETRAGNVAAATKILTQAQMLTQKIGNVALTRSIGQASEELNEKGAMSSGAMKTMRVGASHTVKIDDSDPRQ